MAVKSLLHPFFSYLSPSFGKVKLGNEWPWNKEKDGEITAPINRKYRVMPQIGVATFRFPGGMGWFGPTPQNWRGSGQVVFFQRYFFNPWNHVSNHACLVIFSVFPSFQWVPPAWAARSLERRNAVPSTKEGCLGSVAWWTVICLGIWHRCMDRMDVCFCCVIFMAMCHWMPGWNPFYWVLL